MQQLRVMKFGGTSVGDGPRIAGAAALVKQHGTAQPTVVVVSAMAGITDLLVQCAQTAARGDTAGLDTLLGTLRHRHEAAAKALLSPTGCEGVLNAARQILAEVEKTLQGVVRLGHCPPRAQDAIVGAGERLSTLLLAAALEEGGVPAKGIDATTFLITDDNFGDAAPLLEHAAPKAHEVLQPLLRQGIVPIVTGFIGATFDGTPTTLGRGGSDYSATLVAACLDAAEVWIWTDVEGIFSADPNLVPEAKALAAVTYQEAAELSFYGAKVLHPKTLAPLAERGIPVYIKNTFAPEKPGTLITRNHSGAGGRAITALKGVVLITLESRGELSAVQLIGRAFNALAVDEIDVLMLSQASREESFCFAVHQRDAESVLRRLRETFHLEFTHGYIRPPRVQEGMGVLALVGSGMRGQVGVAAKLFQALASNGINIAAIAQGSSETNISVVIEEPGLATGVRAVHQALLQT